MALSDPYDRKILVSCIREARSVRQISEDTRLPLPTTYRHIHRLLDSGLLVVERSAISSDGKRYDLYRSRIRSASVTIDESGERIEWKENEPVEDRVARIWESLRNL